MATPHVAGVAALWAEKLHTMVRLMFRVIKASAVKQSLLTTDFNAIGAGLVQAPQSKEQDQDFKSPLGDRLPLSRAGATHISRSRRSQGVIRARYPSFHDCVSDFGGLLPHSSHRGQGRGPQRRSSLRRLASWP
jgi:hypothetical protein